MTGPSAGFQSNASTSRPSACRVDDDGRGGGVGGGSRIGHERRSQQHRVQAGAAIARAICRWHRPRPVRACQGDRVPASGCVEKKASLRRDACPWGSPRARRRFMPPSALDESRPQTASRCCVGRRPDPHAGPGIRQGGGGREDARPRAVAAASQVVNRSRRRARPLRFDRRRRSLPAIRGAGTTRGRGRQHALVRARYDARAFDGHGIDCDHRARHPHRRLHRARTRAAEGGQGVVYKATRTKDGRTVAVKVPLSDDAAPGLLQEAERDASRSPRQRRPHPRHLARDDAALLRDGLAGRGTLKGRIDREGPFPARSRRPLGHRPRRRHRRPARPAWPDPPRHQTAATFSRKTRPNWSSTRRPGDQRGGDETDSGRWDVGTVPYMVPSCSCGSPATPVADLRLRRARLLFKMGGAAGESIRTRLT